MRIAFRLLLVVTLLCGVSAGRERPRPGDAPRVFSLNPAAVAALRARIANGGLADPALDRLRADANRALEQSPLSVTRKATTPPGGDKHDYMTLAPYWWPDPQSQNGLPYIRRDGETNPEIRSIPDHGNFDRVMSASRTLALAYYLFGDERYAEHATALLRAWFIDPSTRMNPNLQFAQAVRGRNDGRGTGLIETRGIGRVVDAVGLLAGSKSWTAADQAAMQQWCTQFLAWMRESRNGRDESAAKNNHGTYYDVQVAVLALFTGDDALARRVLEEAKTRHIAAQVEPDGRQPLELARTKSFGYSLMNLRGLFELACMGDRVGVDLWDFRTADGRSIRAALDYLLPFATGEKQWTSKQIAPMNSSELVPLLHEAAAHYQSPAYREAARKIEPGAAPSVEALLADPPSSAAARSAK